MTCPNKVALIPISVSYRIFIILCFVREFTDWVIIRQLALREIFNAYQGIISRLLGGMRLNNCSIFRRLLGEIIKNINFQEVRYAEWFEK